MSETTPIEHPSWLTTGDFTAADEPFRLFAAWLKDASASEPRDPTAMTLATVDADGLPDARMVLLKGVDERGFVFYTNTQSQKGREMAAHPVAAMVFHWKSLNRQIRLRGTVERSRFMPLNTRSATYRDRRSGPVTGCCRCAWNSGTTGRSGCTTASNSCATA